MMKKTAKKISLSLVSLILSLMVADSLFPLFSKRSAQKISISENVSLHENEFGHYWRTSGEQNRQDSGCTNKNAQVKIALVGSSILYGSGTQKEDAFGPKLQEYLQSKGIESCILNYAHPAGNFQTQLASFQDAKEDFNVIIWEVWHNSPSHFWKFGDDLINFGPPPGKELPDPFGIGSLNRILLRYSNIYRYQFSRNLHSPGPMSEVWKKFSDSAFPLMQQEAKKHKSQLLLISFPKASNFEKQLSNNQKTYGYFEQLSKENAVPYFDLTTRLSEPHQQYFSDTCCHYNEQGTIEVSQIIGDELLPLLRLP